MGTAYKIRCRHCGAQFEHHMQPGYGINTTQEEFNEQIEVTYMWD